MDLNEDLSIRDITLEPMPIVETKVARVRSEKTGKMSDKWRSSLDINFLCRWIEAMPQIKFFIEKSQGMMGLRSRGSSGMFNYGKSYGTLLGILHANKCNYTEVHPLTWCKEMHSGLNSIMYPSAKQKSLARVKEIFPHVELLKTKKSSTPDEGFVDALLIAEYGRRQFVRVSKLVPQSDDPPLALVSEVPSLEF